MMRVEIVVIGLPKPAGSKRAFALRRRDGSVVMRPNGAPVVNVTDACKGSAEWKADVRHAAKQQMTDQEPTSEPLSVRMMFYLPRPQGHYGSGKNASALKPSARPYPTTKPDALKLARAAEDALTGVVYRDDSQTVDLQIHKRYGSPARCEIVVEVLQ